MIQVAQEEGHIIGPFGTVKSVDRVFVDGRPADFTYRDGQLFIHETGWREPWSTADMRAMERGLNSPPRKARGLRIHARRVKAAKRRG